MVLSVNAAVADNKPAPPRLHLTPIANAVAQVATALGETARAAPALPAMPAVFAALAAQNESVSTAKTVVARTELPGQTATLPLQYQIPATVTTFNITVTLEVSNSLGDVFTNQVAVGLSRP